MKNSRLLRERNYTFILYFIIIVETTRVCSIFSLYVFLIQTVYQINERIENENQALLMQIKQLLNQNHDLLTQALNSKDHFAEEEKAYL